METPISASESTFGITLNVYPNTVKMDGKKVTIGGLPLEKSSGIPWLSWICGGAVRVKSGEETFYVKQSSIRRQVDPKLAKGKKLFEIAKLFANQASRLQSLLE